MADEDVGADETDHDSNRGADHAAAVDEMRSGMPCRNGGWPVMIMNRDVAGIRVREITARVFGHL